MTAAQDPGGNRLKVALLTREYPPEVYGGAGVHVEYLVRSLRPHGDIRVHCFGAPRDEPNQPAIGALARQNNGSGISSSHRARTCVEPEATAL